MSKPCQDRPVPVMHVDKPISQASVASFVKRKYNPLSNFIGKYETSYLLYSAPDFIAMLEYFINDLSADGVRIYIASYSGAGSSDVPKNYDNLLTLIYSPTENKGTTDDPLYKDKGPYYIIFPGGKFDKGVMLDREIAKEWVKNYQDRKLPYVLNRTFDDPAKTDTKSIHFHADLLYELVEEMKCQKATGIKAYFSTDTNSNSEYFQQLMLQFVLTHRIGNDETDFYIDDQDGFEDRDKAGNLDTGNPCPPAYCAGSELP